jgi:HNH endonuclease
MLKAPKHPRASRTGYVFEHILVIEQRLGRFLHEDESVHHLNGVRDDNREENLELWVRPQPSGIRAKDALAWAWKIIERYGEMDHPQQRSK